MGKGVPAGADELWEGMAHHLQSTLVKLGGSLKGSAWGWIIWRVEQVLTFSLQVFFLLNVNVVASGLAGVVERVQNL